MNEYRIYALGKQAYQVWEDNWNNVISAEVELIMLAAFEISKADVGICPSCHHSFHTFKPDALNYW